MNQRQMGKIIRNVPLQLQGKGALLNIFWIGVDISWLSERKIDPTPIQTEK